MEWFLGIALEIQRLVNLKAAKTSRLCVAPEKKDLLMNREPTAT